MAAEPGETDTMSATKRTAAAHERNRRATRAYWARWRAAKAASAAAGSAAPSSPDRQTAAQVKMSPDSINDPHHWLERAAEMRALSETMKDIETRAIMLRLATDYDKLAERAEARAKGTNST